MSKNHEVEESMRALIEDSRRRLGDPPTPEQLMAYHRGEVAREEAERIREHLVFDPSTLDRLLDLTAHSGGPGEADYLSDADLGEDWEAISSRLRLKGANVLPFRSPPRWRWRERIVAMAAVLVFAVLGMRVMVLSRHVDELSRRGAEPQVNETLYELLPDGRRGGATEEPPIRISLEESGAHLVFGLFGDRSFHRHRLEIHKKPIPEEGSEPLWSTEDIIRGSDNSFRLGLPRDFFAPGEYSFRLYGIVDGDEELLATYSVRI